MITLIEALNYRCLRYVSQPLQPFHVLVGPNASGKTTFLDVIGFLSDIVSNNFDQALTERTSDLLNLLFRNQGRQLELAIEARVPEAIRKRKNGPEFNTVRYQLVIGLDEKEQGGFELKAETLMLKQGSSSPRQTQRSLFPQPRDVPDSLQENIWLRNNKVLLNKVPGGHDNFYPETETTKPPRKSWAIALKLGPRKSALGNFPADETAFPTAMWFREYLTVGVQRFMFNSLAIKHPNPPTRITGFMPDGANFSWVVARLSKSNPDRYSDWIQHLRTALPELIDIETVERPEDRHCYMVYNYEGGLKVPSWLVSDGTLRLAALTLPAYLPDLQGVYLVEEPENGIHPGAVQTVLDSLTSMYNTQVLLATHSPVVLNAADAKALLCFAKDENGATDIVLGTDHPELRKWRKEVDLGTLLASGVLG